MYNFYFVSSLGLNVGFIFLVGIEGLTLFFLEIESLLGDLTAALGNQTSRTSNSSKTTETRDTVVNHSCLGLGRGKVS